MQDRFGKEITVGAFVKVADYINISPHSNWIVMGFINNPLAVEVILQSFIDGSVTFVSVLDIEKVK